MNPNHTFIKFPHIDNYLTAKDSMDQSTIATIDSKPGLNWVATEKLDGSNVGLYITKNDYWVAKRNSLVCGDNDLVSVSVKVRELLSDFIKKVQFVIPDNITYIFYGEYYGLGIQNRIFYGMERKFKFFHVVKIIDKQIIHLSWNDIESLLGGLGYSDLLVPVIGKFKTFNEAVACNNDMVSTLTDEEHKSIMEGLVIRPIHEPGFNEVHSDLQMIVKSKNDIFREQHRAGVKRYEAGSEYSNLKNEFLGYLTKNRMYSVFSKLGHPTCSKDIGRFVMEFNKDAIEDFERDHPEIVGLDDEERKFILKTTSQGFLAFKSVVAELGLKIKL